MEGKRTSGGLSALQETTVAGNGTKDSLVRFVIEGYLQQKASFWYLNGNHVADRV